MRPPRLARALPAPFAFGCATHAFAEVRQGAPETLLLGWSHRAVAAPSAVHEAIGQIECGWSREHTNSGDASKMSMRLGAGSCFCKRWRDGKVGHGRVIPALQNRFVRVAAAVGRLQARDVSAVLTFSVKAQERGTVLDATYRVNGVAARALEKDAASVDRVFTGQVARLVRCVETGKATS